MIRRETAPQTPRQTRRQSCRQTRRPGARPALALLAALLATPAAAGTTLDAQYTLGLRGVNGGAIAMRATEEGGGYAVSARAQASGLVGALVAYSFEGATRGRVSEGRHVPQTYSETEVDDDERTVATTRFRGTTPRDVTFTPPRDPRPWDIDPAAQSGVIDPMTALYRVLRPVAPGGACAQSYDLFDGRHVSRIALGPAQAAADGTLRCAGEYRRLRGYDPEKLADQPVVALSFTYAPLGDGRVQVSEIRSATRLGDAVLRRK